MFHVAEINDLDHLWMFDSAWQTLWERTPHRSLFQTREWLECYFQQFGDARKLRTLIVFGPSRPIGIVPLVVKRMPTRLGRLRVLTYPLDGWGPFIGPIGSDPAATMYGALKHLAGTPRDWDLLDLRSINDEQIDKGRTANAFRMAGLAATKRDWEINQEISLADWSTGDEFLVRRQVRDAERTIDRVGKWEFIRVRVDDDAAEASDCRDLFQLCRPLLTQNDDSFRWLDGVLEAAIATRTADLCLLRVNGRPAVAALSAAANGMVTPIAIGAAPEAGPVAETLCLGRMLLDGLDRGDASYLFGPRTRAWADEWPGISRPSHRFTHFAALKPRAQLLRLNELRKRFWSRVDSPSAAIREDDIDLTANENSPRQFARG